MLGLVNSATLWRLKTCVLNPGFQMSKSLYVTEKMLYLKYLRTFIALLHPERHSVMILHLKHKIIKAV